MILRFSYSKAEKVCKYSIEALLFFCLFLNIWNITHVVEWLDGFDVRFIDFFTGQIHYGVFVISPIPDLIFNILFCGVIIWYELDTLNGKHHFIKLQNTDNEIQNLRGDKQ